MNTTMQFAENTDPFAAQNHYHKDVQNFDEWKLDNLTDYIINTHHRYAKENSVVIYDMAQKVAYKHSENHPELSELFAASFLFLHDLLNQMMDEEKELFPGIKQLLANKRKSELVVNTHLEFIKNSVKLMEKQNKEAATVLNIFRKLTNDYSLPADACNLYTYLFEKMKEFEDNLFLHIHLENDILFRKVMAIQEEPDKNLIKNNAKRLTSDNALTHADFQKSV
jgi:regulator of cell morphogenesis and NO signaling